MKLKVTIFMLIIFICISLNSFAMDTVGYWHVDLPVMKGANNLVIKKKVKFSTLSKTYEIKISNPSEVREFYNNFFESIGYNNWLAKISDKGEAVKKWKSNSGGWSSYRFYINSEGKPEAIYQLMWSAEKIPVHGILRLDLLDYSDGVYKGRVDVSIVPDLDIDRLTSQMMELFKEPKNFFIISRAIKGNPIVIDSVSLKGIDQADLSDPVVKKYHSIVNEIVDEYKQFHLKYNK